MCHYLSFGVGVKQGGCNALNTAVEELCQCGTPLDAMKYLLVGDGHNHSSIDSRYSRSIFYEGEWTPHGWLEIRGMKSVCHQIEAELHRIFGLGEEGFKRFERYLSGYMIGFCKTDRTVVLGQSLYKQDNGTLAGATGPYVVQFGGVPLAPPRGRTLVRLASVGQEPLWALRRTGDTIHLSEFLSIKVPREPLLTNLRDYTFTIPDVEIVEIEVSNDVYFMIRTLL